jgi:dTDP-4-amino-4,6-dideoxygalactose transaminase
MQMKKDYLNGNGVDKYAFREKYLKSEELLSELSISGIDTKSRNIAQTMNLRMWCDLKTENWLTAYELLKDKYNVLKPTNISDYRYPFSLVIVTPTAKERENLKSYLIKHQIYPAILWQLPEDTQYKDSLDISQRILSIHCDARYSKNQIKEMCEIILQYK